MAATYCFTCRGCGASWENSAAKLGIHPSNGCTNTDIIRDYRSEAVGVGSGVRESRVPPDTQALHRWAEKASEAEGL